MNLSFKQCAGNAPAGMDPDDMFVGIWVRWRQMNVDAETLNNGDDVEGAVDARIYTNKQCCWLNEYGFIAAYALLPPKNQPTSEEIKSDLSKFVENLK